MKHSVVYFGIFSFLVFSIILSHRYSVVKSAFEADALRALENVRKEEVVYAPTAEAVLGATFNGEGTERFDIISNGRETVLHQLQSSHVVIIEYTSEGAIVRAIDGVGSSENERNVGKAWKIKTEGQELPVSLDKYTPEKDQKILFVYE